MFSNVMDLKITALNAKPVPLHQVVMELEVPHVSCFELCFKQGFQKGQLGTSQTGSCKDNIVRPGWTINDLHFFF